MDDMDEADRLQLTGLRADVTHLLETVNEIKARLNGIGNSHITKEAFEALKDRVQLMEKIVFGALGVVLITVLGAIIALVIRK